MARLKNSVRPQKTNKLMAFRNRMRSYGSRFRRSFRRPRFRRSFNSFNPMRKKSSFMTIAILLVGAFLLKDKIPFIGNTIDKLTGKGGK